MLQQDVIAVNRSEDKGASPAQLQGHDVPQPRTWISPSMTPAQNGAAHTTTHSICVRSCHRTSRPAGRQRLFGHPSSSSEAQVTLGAHASSRGWNRRPVHRGGAFPSVLPVPRHLLGPLQVPFRCSHGLIPPAAPVQQYCCAGPMAGCCLRLDLSAGCHSLCPQVCPLTQEWSQMPHRGAEACERTALVPGAQCAHKAQHRCVASKPFPNYPLHLPMTLPLNAHVLHAGGPHAARHRL